MPRTKKTVAVLDPLEAMLTRLKLTGIRDQLVTLLDEAARTLSARETLGLFCEREEGPPSHRHGAEARALAGCQGPRELRLRGATLRRSQADPRSRRGPLDRQCRNLLLLGPPGVGKTHLAIALGREAILAGYAVERLGS